MKSRPAIGGSSRCSFASSAPIAATSAITIGTHGRVAHEHATACLARHAAHQVEQLADDRLVFAQRHRLRRGDPGVERRLENPILLLPAPAHRYPRGRVRAQHQLVPAVERAASAGDVERPILLDGAAAEQREMLNGDRGGTRFGGEPARQRIAPGAQGHAKKSPPCSSRLRATTIRCTSEAPSTSRAWRA